ncbi:MAG TPA: hypothetical protein VGN57_08095 [Pirellulaceae bacterium]|jgi:hypothetical protein|nr:hypothetical protein [Pirellulaceae bacterium]
MLRQALVSLKVAALAALLAASTANAQDLDVSSIAKDDVKKEASSGSWLPSWGSPSKKAPAVASGSSSSAAWYDPMGLFTGSSEPEAKQPVRRSGLGVTNKYNGSTLDNTKYVKTSGGAWWDPFGLIVPSDETVVYEDVNGFLSQPRMDD